MGTRNFRLIDFGTHRALHEVYYDAFGAPWTYAEEPATFICQADRPDTDLFEEMAMAKADAAREWLTPADFHGGVDQPDEPVADPTDPFVRHEAMDRASVIADTFSTALLSHPAVQGNPELKAKAVAAFHAITDVYREAAKD